jgi:ABC-type cobalamin/Fe3+-siderophores transport system ATPase subunit
MQYVVVPWIFLNKLWLLKSQVPHPHFIDALNFTFLPCLLFLQGRMVEIFGKEACGKTTLALHIIREAQKRGGTDMSIT